ncbi:hypothetical protein OESDEN_12354 [Oesophagostomum dentatum]|uniref:SF4 helicase domain-containing protein n=1 Tax=Oesophagostomum dentatum TaxID=61180 RepID=A0A0B1SSC6_OESDE|nr:hypothetical protein OESDEN_12354 [Oesophagostomum dentatum]
MSEETTSWDRYFMQDRFVGYMRALATQHEVHVTMVVHPRKIDTDTDLDVQHFGGSARVTQEADNVFALQRRRDDHDRRKFRKFLYILKNRYGGHKVETDQLEMVFHPDTYTHTIIDHSLNAIRNYVVNSGCQHVIIDNLQFLVNQSTMSEETTSWDRYFMQDRFVGYMRSLATQHEVHVTMVVHPRKIDADTDLDVQHFGGSARVTQEADNVFALQRRRDDHDRRKFRKFLYILKNRYGGHKVETDQLEMVFHPDTYTHTIIDHSLNV